VTLVNTNAALVAYLLSTPSPTSRIPTLTPCRIVAPIPLHLYHLISPSVYTSRHLYDYKELLTYSPTSPELRPLSFDEAKDAKENS
jgi:hypothetical protein